MIPEDKRRNPVICFNVRGEDGKIIVVGFHESMFQNFRGWKVHFPTVERKMFDVVFERRGFS